MIQKLSDYIADFLFKNGITDMFTVTGGGAMHLNDSFGHKDGLNVIYNHHEQACSIAAEGYTRFSNKLCAVCVTTGPGGTNAITGVYGAYVDSIPMLVISGQVKRETTVYCNDLDLRQLGDQEINIIDLVSSITKYSVMVTKPEEIKYHLEKALYLALNGRPGPVWLDIPVDVQASKIETDDLKGFNANEEKIDIEENPVYDENYTKIIIDKIKESKRPVILAGTGIRTAGYRDKFIKFVEKLNIPVLTAWNAHDLIEENHQLFVGKPGTVGTRGGNFVIQNADLVLVIGCRLNIRMISYNYKKFAPNAYKIVIDIDKKELNKPTINPDMKIHADLRNVIDSILDNNYQKENDDTEKKWIAWCKKVNNNFPVVLESYFEKKSPVNPYVFIDKLFDELDKDDCIVCGNGSACVIGFQACKVKDGQRLFTNSGCAAMGYGFPAALGAAISRKGKRVICLDGDGSFQMNIQELQTVIHNNINLKIFILNNNGYHSIRQTQSNLFKPPFVGVSKDSGISFPSTQKIANAYGLKYNKIDNLDNINEIINMVLNESGPIICEVILDENQKFEPKLSSKALPDGSMISSELDDMYPFLSKNEYDELKKEALNIK